MRAAAWWVGAVLLTASAPAWGNVKSCLDAAERAQPLRASGELRRAREELITCSAEACPRAVRADCTRWLGEVVSAMPLVVVQARGADGSDVVDVTVSVDGLVQQRRLDGLAIPVDPGTRVFRFESPGRTSVEQTLAIREGEKHRVVPVTLMRLGEIAPGPSAATAPPPAARAGDASQRGVPVAAWALGGAGLLAIGGGALLWASGLSERHDLRAQCASAPSCAQSDIDAAKSKLLLGDVLVGVGVVAIAVGVWLGLRSSGHASPVLTVGSTGSGLLHTF